jgi:glycerophosphoryl diester phosphodiesterase
MTVKVLGHRGLRQHPEVDENSAKAFEVALKTADGIETDAAVSADKTVFLSHEITQKYVPGLISRSLYVFSQFLDKASAAIVDKRRLEEVSDSEVDSLRLKKGAKIPRLSELFNQAAQYPDKTINIELKGEGTVEAVIKEIKKAVAAGQITKDQIILTSFNHLAIQKARELDPDIKCGLIFSGSAKFDSRIFPWSDNEDSHYVEFNKEALDSKIVKDINPEFFILKAEAVTPENIKMLKEKFDKAKIMFWMTKEKAPEENSEVVKILSDPEIAPVVEAVITDYPKQMTKMLKEKGLKI